MLRAGVRLPLTSLGLLLIVAAVGGVLVRSSGPGVAASTVSITQIAAGAMHTCALLDTGRVRCWGWGGSGQLGFGNTENIGDDETPGSVGEVNVGGPVTEIATGQFHTCALLDAGGVRCWGGSRYGQLGYVNTENVGDDETPASAGDVDVGGTVIQITAGGYHTCALLDTGGVRCWGSGGDGQLGYANTEDIGDDETPASAGEVNIGGRVTQIAAGTAHTCALLDTGTVRCWGSSVFAQLGYANTENIGDDETPASAGDINVGGTVTQIAAGTAHTCALLDTGTVRCWGSAGASGQLGYANFENIGDDETPASAGDVDVGGKVTQVATGTLHTCVLLDTGGVRCWGLSSSGQLGYRNTKTIGDNEHPAEAGNVNVGGTVSQITTGALHTCALLSSGGVRCWGLGSRGQLGYANTEDVGDNERPRSAGDVEG